MKGHKTAKALKVESHPITDLVKSTVKKYAASVARDAGRDDGGYSFTNWSNWRSYSSSIYVHKSGLFVWLKVRSIEVTYGNSHTQGYLTIDHNIRLAHRVVGFVWKENKENLPILNHIDGNKENNCVDNLEWCSTSHNILHARKSGLNPYNKPTQGQKIGGQRKGASKYFGVLFEKGRQKWVAQVRHDNVLYGRRRFETEEEAAQHYNNVCDLHGILEKPRNEGFPKQRIKKIRLKGKTIRMIGKGTLAYSIIE